ncbi:hypothetical protein B5807_11189 [Epicoccum nigrum]|uniref:Uncharacterized protein n=1 Tax=Epicoccum nigrum TaxID=105696 RepID=A0A1Y2LJS2_EPING|nr:hypothetical protein B5807_11189 [Epicoccum nigrum]
MVRGDRAEDNPGSIAMKRWVTCAHYQPDVIEAFAHKVFDCLLAQVKEGFRGWHHNDYVDDDRKGEERDYKVDCEGRLDNIIDALEREKTICEDVMNSGSQIRMFVNAPIAYAARKYQNRLGNSKRGRANMADPNPRPAKKRQGARSNRARSTTVASGGARSRDTTPHLLTSGAVAGPYYRTSHSQHQPATSNPAYSTPRSQPYNLVPPSTSQDLANYTPVPTAAPNPRLRYPSATSQNFAGYIPTTTATAPTPMLRPPSATSQPPAMSRPPHSTSQQRRTYIPPTPPPAHFQTRPSYFPTPPAHFSTPQTSHVPTPSLYPLNHRSPPFPKIDEHSSLSPAPGLWAQQGFAPATAGGYDALPASLVDPLLFGDGGGGGDNGHGGDQGNGGHGSGAGPAGANEDADDLFSQLIWAADLQPGTPAGHMPTHVSLADVEGRGAEAGDAFESFWEQQERVRMFSFEAGGETSGSASARAGAGVGDSKGKGKTKRSGDGGEGDAKGMPKRSGDDYEGVKPKRRSE